MAASHLSRGYRPERGDTRLGSHSQIGLCGLTAVTDAAPAEPAAPIVRRRHDQGLSLSHQTFTKSTRFTADIAMPGFDARAAGRCGHRDNQGEGSFGEFADALVRPFDRLFHAAQ